MISELRVRDLGVIADVRVVLADGMTAITGETGTGKTLIVDALELLVGGRSDPSMVRTGANETTVEGQFFCEEEEIIIARTIPAVGRSRSSINGALSPLASLVELGQDLVDLYGQHAHQSLLRPLEQRRALDAYAEIDHGTVTGLRSEIAQIDARLNALGGDDRMRLRELDLALYELAEIDALQIEGPDEDDRLAGEHDLLQAAVALHEATAFAYEALDGGGVAGATETIARAVDALERHHQLGVFSARLRALNIDLADCVTDIRRAAETFEENPERLEEVRERRAQFARMIKKHGSCLGDVLDARKTLAGRVEELQGSEELREKLNDERGQLTRQLRAAETIVGDQRRAAAGPLAHQVEDHLGRLGLDGARLFIDVPEEGIGDDVTFLLAANRGEAALALAKVASGGELARTMLALRLVLSAGPPTLIFDEVDAGIGGEAAIAVGRALAELGRHHQVIVVTHLPQVAAYANHQLVVDKYEDGGRTLSRVVAVEGEERISELARMLSGHPDSDVAKQHARELLIEVSSTTKSKF